MSKQFADLLHKKGCIVKVITLSGTKDLPYEVLSPGNRENPKKEIISYLSQFRPDFVIYFGDITSTLLVKSWQSTSVVENSILVLNYNETLDKKISSAPRETREYIGNILSNFKKLVTFNNSVVFKKLEENYGVRFEYIPNFITKPDIIDNQKIMRKIKLRKKKKTILYFGRSDEGKNIKGLLRVYRESGVFKDKNLLLVCAANTEKEKRYLAECKQEIKGLPSMSVSFLKPTTKMGELFGIIGSCDVFILPSVSEGSPLSIQESISCGTPWISTPVGNIREMYGDCPSGVIFDRVDFTPEEFRRKINEATRISRETVMKQWDENYSKNCSFENYSDLMERMEEPKQVSDLVNQTNFSFAVCAYNEERTLERYFKSVLKSEIPVGDIHVVNHRSIDGTEEVIKKYISVFAEKNITLSYRNESRDFAKDFLMSDLRQDSADGCAGDVIFIHDADFVLGPSYHELVHISLSTLRRGDYYAAGYPIPVVRGGTCRLHPATPTVLIRGKYECRQDHVDGRYFWFHSRGQSRCASIERIVKNSIISIDDKGAERDKLRSTMNDFFVRVKQGKIPESVGWIDFYQSGDLEKKSQAEENTQRVYVDMTGENYCIF